MSTKSQIFIIHGGTTFRRKKDYLNFLKTRPINVDEKVRWTDGYLKKSLGSDFDIIKPRMPLQDNARYNEWKIYFERFLPHLRDGVILIGISLGGIFLAKYLSEHKFPHHILSVYLICPPFDDSIPGEDLVGGFRLKSNLSLLDTCSQNLYLMFSKDDEVVPVSHAEKFKGKLANARILLFESKFFGR